ncbi:anticodon binding domain-containing protein [Cyclospora cayetanensis]|uniref:Anticodon binding domain-containing protein n=1 Tax=Cyclospora cayetanensis TaxID=88456 RepID=A0A1D3CUI9_9EIME|nr:anticodon binding domain-containing protein [Cyclospora cayetanensis]
MKTHTGDNLLLSLQFSKGLIKGPPMFASFSRSILQANVRGGCVAPEAQLQLTPRPPTPTPPLFHPLPREAAHVFEERRGGVFALQTFKVPGFLLPRVPASALGEGPYRTRFSRGRGPLGGPASLPSAPRASGSCTDGAGVTMEGPSRAEGAASSAAVYSPAGRCGNVAVEETDNVKKSESPRAAATGKATCQKVDEENSLDAFGSFSVLPRESRLQPGLQSLAAFCRSNAIAGPSCSLYGGLRGVLDFGVCGQLLLDNLRAALRVHFTSTPLPGGSSLWESEAGLDELSKEAEEEASGRESLRDRVFLVETAALGPPPLWRHSGHLHRFRDDAVECTDSGTALRLDALAFRPPNAAAGRKAYEVAFTEGATASDGLLACSQQGPGTTPHGDAGADGGAEEGDAERNNGWLPLSEVDRRLSLAASLDSAVPHSPSENYLCREAPLSLYPHLPSPISGRPGALQAPRPFDLMMHVPLKRGFIRKSDGGGRHCEGGEEASSDATGEKAYTGNSDCAFLRPETAQIVSEGGAVGKCPLFCACVGLLPACMLVGLGSRHFASMWRLHLGIAVCGVDIATALRRPVARCVGCGLGACTLQNLFVAYKFLLPPTLRAKLPFGVAQEGRAYRNEMSTTRGSFLLRLREFRQFEIEYFVSPREDWDALMEQWAEHIRRFFVGIGIPSDCLRADETPQSSLPHYASRCIDISYLMRTRGRDASFAEGRCRETVFESPKELCGLALRGDYDLRRHQTTFAFELGSAFYVVPKLKGMQVVGLMLCCVGMVGGGGHVKVLLVVVSGEEATGRANFCWLQGIGLTLWLLFATLHSAMTEDLVLGRKRFFLNLHPAIAPYKAAIFPIVATNQLVQALGRSIHHKLRRHFSVLFDDTGSLGRRYRKSDELGVPFCISVDSASLHSMAVKLRWRNSAGQAELLYSTATLYSRPSSIFCCCFGITDVHTQAIIMLSIVS